MGDEGNEMKKNNLTGDCRRKLAEISNKFSGLKSIGISGEEVENMFSAKDDVVDQLQISVSRLARKTSINEKKIERLQSAIEQAQSWLFIETIVLIVVLVVLVLGG